MPVDYKKVDTQEVDCPKREAFGNAQYNHAVRTVNHRSAMPRNKGQRKKYQNPTVEQVRLNGVSMDRNVMISELRGGPAKMEDNRVARIRGSAHHCPIAEELAAWKEHFDMHCSRSSECEREREGKRNLSVAGDYLIFLTNIEKRLNSQRDQLQRRYAVLDAIQSNPRNRRQQIYQKQLSQVRKQIDRMNENITTWVNDNKALREHKYCKDLENWVHSKYVKIGGEYFNKSHLIADEKISFEDALEQMKQEMAGHDQGVKTAAGGVIGAAAEGGDPAAAGEIAAEEAAEDKTNLWWQ